ncbi:homeobox-domain-containing protein [Neoconidiobolus thromboides FSU 785]|nr:homeobox-domain-containing protein [Neoconidiobolus thromboides FSU 785]
MNYSYFNPNSSYELIQSNGMISPYYPNAMPPNFKNDPLMYNTLFPLNEVKQRKKISRGQLKLLEKTYQETSKPNLNLRKFLANKLNMTPRSVQIWFQNKRAKDKLKNNSKSNTNATQETDNGIKEETTTFDHEFHSNENETEEDNHPSTSNDIQDNNEKVDHVTINDNKERLNKRCPAPLNLLQSNISNSNSTHDMSMFTTMMTNNTMMNMQSSSLLSSNSTNDNTNNPLNGFITTPLCLTPLSAGFPNVFTEESDEQYFRRNSFPLESQLKNTMVIDSNYYMPATNNTAMLNESFTPHQVNNPIFNSYYGLNNFQPYRNGSFDVSVLNMSSGINENIQYNNNLNNNNNNLSGYYY